jgi:hypothetical protein
MRVKFETDNTFAQAILKQDNIKGQKLYGIHNMDASNGVTKDGNLLLKYDSKTSIGSIDGKVAYEIDSPQAYIPDIDNLKSINRGKSLDNRTFTSQGRYISKDKVGGKRVSSTFPEGMTEAEVEELISYAFLSP